jgi:coenzyme F420 hydrogenase subunit beta
MSSVEIVKCEGVCIGCGTCSTVCPANAIKLIFNLNVGDYEPSINETKCLNCGICLKVCPSNGVINVSKGIIGDFKKLYTGYSTDSNLRFSCSSGGIATAILLSALEEKVIEGAILTKMSETTPIKAEIFLATKTQDIVMAKGSKYNISPVGMGINYIKENNGKFAVVGLPCHLLAYKKASEVIPEIKDRVVLYIGLMCNHAPYSIATRFLFEKAKIDPEKVESIDYRGSGWPGGMTVMLNENRKLFFPLTMYWPTFFSSYFYSPLRCLLCPDATSELADVSLGDAWSLELEDSLGTSIIVCRTEKGEKLINRCIAKGKIQTNNIPLQKVLLSNKKSIFFKKRAYYRSKILTRSFKKGRVIKFRYYSKAVPVSPLNPLGDLLVLANSILTKNQKWVYRLLLRVPTRIIKLYNVLVDILR